MGETAVKEPTVDPAVNEMWEVLAQKGDRLVEKWSRIPRNSKLVRGLQTEDPRLKTIDFLEGVENPNTRRLLAILYENSAKENMRLEEMQRAFMAGPYEKMVLGIIRAVYANSILDKIVSVQPLDAPTGRIFYLDVRYTQTKGQITAGNSAFSATTGPARGVGYPSEVVDNEAIRTGDGMTALETGNLTWLPIRPGTVAFTDGAQVVKDDGNGNLVCDCYAGGTINYVTGFYTFTWMSAPTPGTPVTCDYEYNMEANSQVPELDVILTSTPVTARMFKLKARWSLEAEQDLKAYHGLSAEEEIVNYQANEITRELCYRVVRSLQATAGAGAVTWSRTPLPGVPWKWHKEQLFDRFVECSELIFAATQRWGATWAICGVEVAQYIQTLDRFVPAGKATKGSAGIQYIGTLGDFDIYKDPTINRSQWLMGYRGDGLMETGFVHAVYLGLYTTPTVTLADFISQKGMGTRCAQKLVNSLLYATGTITA